MSRIRKLRLIEILFCLFSFLTGWFPELHASEHKSFNFVGYPLPSNSDVKLTGVIPIPGARDDIDFTKVWKICTVEAEGRKAVFVGGENWFEYPNLFMAEIAEQKILLEDEERSGLVVQLKRLLKSNADENIVSIRTAFGPFRLAKRCVNPESKYLRKFVYVYQYEPYFDDTIYVTGSTDERGAAFIKQISELL